MKLRFLPAAREELEAAALYLDARAPGLGADLVGDVERGSVNSSVNSNRLAALWTVCTD
jgi:hypothetical protein